MKLQTALLLLGAAVLLALLVHGLWQARRAGPKRASGDGASTLPGDRVEPALGAVAGDTLPSPDARAMRRPARLDPLIDAIATLALDAPLSGDFVLGHLPPTRRAGSKALIVEGLDAGSGDWSPIRAGARYGELQAGVQLASRSGPLNEIEYSEFVQKVQAFADAVGAAADVPDMLDAVARARELDGLASPLDAQLTVTLAARGAAWSVPYLQQAAARHGFVAGAMPGRLVLPSPDDGAPPLLALTFDARAALADEPQQAAVRSATLVLDVAQSPARHEPFPLWHRTATALAGDIDAALVDDHAQPVTLHAFAAIGRDLELLYQRLEALDLTAGSAAARRIFS